MRKIRRAAWKIAALPFWIVAAVAGLILYGCMTPLERLERPERPELMTDEEKREYYGYGRNYW